MVVAVPVSPIHLNKASSSGVAADFRNFDGQLNAWNKANPRPLICDAIEINSGSLVSVDFTTSTDTYLSPWSGLERGRMCEG